MERDDDDNTKSSLNALFFDENEEKEKYTK
jgi:hypothetical protein